MGLGDHESVTELDFHANMPVIGKHSTRIQTTGLHAEVHGFFKDLPSIQKVPISDFVMAYDDPYSLNTYLLVCRNALDMPSSDNNLLPPFMMREAGLRVNEEPKRQAETPTIDHHAIFDEKTGLRIHLQLNGIFSYFPTRALTQQEIEHWEEYEVINLTPDADSWDPHDETFAREEEGYVDHDGDLAILVRSLRRSC